MATEPAAGPPPPGAHFGQGARPAGASGYSGLPPGRVTLAAAELQAQQPPPHWQQQQAQQQQQQAAAAQDPTVAAVTILPLSSNNPSISIIIRQQRRLHTVVSNNNSPNISSSSRHCNADLQAGRSPRLQVVELLVAAVLVVGA